MIIETIYVDCIQDDNIDNININKDRPNMFTKTAIF